MPLVDHLRPILRQTIVCAPSRTRIISPLHPMVQRNRKHVREHRRIPVDQFSRTNHPSHRMNYRKSLYQVISLSRRSDEPIRFSPLSATIDTEHLSLQVRELLSANSIGQRVFGRVSIILSLSREIIAAFRWSSIESIARYRQWNISQTSPVDGLEYERSWTVHTNVHLVSRQW